MHDLLKPRRGVDPVSAGWNVFPGLMKPLHGSALGLATELVGGAVDQRLVEGSSIDMEHKDLVEEINEVVPIARAAAKETYRLVLVGD